MAIDEKHAQLEALFREMESVVVAYSGGGDSALVAKVARDVLGPRALAVSAVSPSYPAEELEGARRVAAEIGIAHELVESHELDNPSYATNPLNRCYFCKTELYDLLGPLARARGFRFVVDGTNCDDLQDWRPGLQAKQEHGVRSPLVEAGYRKADVRALAKAIGLSTWDKPAAACLSSRVPYGEAITPERLKRIDEAEALLHREGYRHVRVRDHGVLARIELPPEQLAAFIASDRRETIVEGLRKLGYAFVTVDLRGYRPGSFNEAQQR